LYSGQTVTTTATAYATFTSLTGSWAYTSSLLTSSNHSAKALLDYGLQNTTVTFPLPTTVTLQGTSDPFVNATLISGSLVSYTDTCDSPVLRVQGIISGSFGKYNGTFSVTGLGPSVNACNVWQSGSGGSETVLLDSFIRYQKCYNYKSILTRIQWIYTYICKCINFNQFKY